MIRSIVPLGAALLVYSPSASAQALEEVVVTARMQTDGYYDMPAITVKKAADFLVQKIRLVNDSRNPSRRREEIIDTIAGLLKTSRRIDGIELSYGDGFLVPVNINDDSLQLINDRDRIDTSFVDIFVKVRLGDPEDTKARIGELRRFIRAGSKTGRTEIDALGDVGLSIVGPEQYRYEILAKITEENQKIRDIVGEDCKITIGGLEGRVDWERTGVGELTLYIPYGTEIACE